MDRPTVDLGDLIASVNFVKMEEAISSAMFDIAGKQARPIIKIDPVNPIDFIDPDTGIISLRFSGRMMIPSDGERIVGILTESMAKLDLRFEHTFEDGFLKFTVSNPMVSFDTSLVGLPEDLDDSPDPDESDDSAIDELDDLLSAGDEDSAPEEEPEEDDTESDETEAA